VRTPSPLLLDRIRSFDNDNHHDIDPSSPYGQEQGPKNFGADCHNELSSKGIRERINYDDKEKGNNNQIATRYNTGRSNIANYDNTQNRPTVDTASGRFHEDSGNRLGSGTIVLGR